jgi:symplekin
VWKQVIQAVQTYKSLQAFVSTTLLSRLILKKIWTQPQLWEGFMRCAKIISPHSFGAILQLPRDQLKELVGKQVGLKAPLREYVTKSKKTSLIFQKILWGSGAVFYYFFFVSYVFRGRK